MAQEIVKQNSLFAQLAQKYNISEKSFLETLKNTIMKPDRTGRPATEAEIVSFLLVASKYDLNPFTKEIYAFPDKRAGIVPIVGVDGFITLANRQPNFDGYEISWSDNIVSNDTAKSCPEWCEVKVYRKDRQHPIIVREYLDEVYQPPRSGFSGPWQSHTKRMLRHKTLIQAFRIAFGFVGIYDEDEAERIIEATAQPTMKPQVKMPQELPPPQSTQAVPPAPTDTPPDTQEETIDRNPEPEWPEEEATEEPASPPAKKTNVISEPQGKRLYAIARGKGYTEQDIKGFLHEKYGLEHTKDIDRSDYEEICSHFSKPKKNE